MLSSFDSLWLLDSGGETIWRRSPHSDFTPDQTRRRTIALQALKQAKTLVSQTRSGDPDRWRTVSIIAAPVIHPDGTSLGALVGEVPVRHSRDGDGFLPSITLTSDFYIIDDQGAMTMSSAGEASDYHQEHLGLLDHLVQGREPGAMRHRSSTVGDHMVAFVPLMSLGGGVIFEEHDDQVLATAQRLRRTLLIMGSAAMAMASGAAWFYVRNMVQPVLTLREASNRIAEGDLHEPVTVERQDEIGDLAAAFESMRVRLLDAERKHLEWEHELENRVNAQSAQLRRLLSNVVSAQEAERKRVARELHDGATQMMTTLILQIEGMAAALPSDSRAATELAPVAKTYSMQVIEEMRRVIHDLRPPALDDLGLVAALREYAEQKFSSAHIAVEFRIVGQPVHSNDDLETAVYRIVQEAINNAASHSQATNAAVTLEFEPDRLRADVDDDGVGFILQDVLRDSLGVGLAGMFERAEALGGQLEVRSEPGSGTRVTLEVSNDTG